MGLKLNSSCFGVKVMIAVSSEKGTITGFSGHMRGRTKQFYVEYCAADGRSAADWFFADQLVVISSY